MSYTATHMSRRQGGNRGPVSNKEDVGTVILPRLLPKARTLHMLVEVSLTTNIGMAQRNACQAPQI